MPDITVIVGVLHPIQYLFYSKELIWAQHHQALITFMQYNIFPDNLTERTLFQEKYSKLIQFIERQICCIRPVKCELISTIGIIGEIASVYTIGDDKQLNIVEQPMKGCLMIALYLIVCLFEFYTPTFQFNLNQRETIDKNRYIIATLLSSLHSNLIRYLKLVLTPLGAIKELYPYALSVSRIKRI